MKPRMDTNEHEVRHGTRTAGDLLTLEAVPGWRFLFMYIVLPFLFWAVLTGIAGRDDTPTVAL
jgi:hypothetical protein